MLPSMVNSLQPQQCTSSCAFQSPCSPAHPPTAHTHTHTHSVPGPLPGALARPQKSFNGVETLYGQYSARSADLEFCRYGCQASAPAWGVGPRRWCCRRSDCCGTAAEQRRALCKNGASSLLRSCPPYRHHSMVLPTRLPSSLSLASAASQTKVSTAAWAAWQARHAALDAWMQAARR